MDKSREQFEEWWCQYADEPLSYVKGQRSGLNGYYNEFIDRAWHAWQASRSVVEIELPPLMQIEEPGISFCAYGRAGVLNAIYEHGLKVKQ